MFTYAIGFLAQGFFSARTIVQWFLSEKRREVVSPTLFWALSLAGSFLMFTYGWLRDDFAILLGQVISYYIYIWNLRIKGVWQRVPLILRGGLTLLPPVGITALATHTDFTALFLQNADIPLWLVIFGSAGQVIFTLRFIYQWYYSRRQGESQLPRGFWWISLFGSAVIVCYGLLRLDPVLILGQSVGFIAYIRNLMIGHHAHRP
ncbi:MAG: lipid-A-disaccharide synthase N-terminal domain-containing protein [Bacteroidaceae bacterium]|nr:lipid-A-disaccharide synthase N-terminal domain-containing protein [Bacteroidaceae bacterium]